MYMNHVKVKAVQGSSEWPEVEIAGSCEKPPFVGLRLERWTHKKILARRGGLLLTLTLCGHGNGAWLSNAAAAWCPAGLSFGRSPGHHAWWSPCLAPWALLTLAHSALLSVLLRELSELWPRAMGLYVDTECRGENPAGQGAFADDHWESLDKIILSFADDDSLFHWGLIRARRGPIPGDFLASVLADRPSFRAKGLPGQVRNRKLVWPFNADLACDCVPSADLSCRSFRRQRTFSISLCRNEIGLVSARMTAWSAGQCLDDVFLMIGHLTSFHQKSLIKLMSANERGLGHQNENIYYIH